MTRRRFIVETLDDSPPYTTTADLLRQSTWLSVTEVARSPDPGARVGFIYDGARAESPCHAVLYDKSGPWSAHLTGFCGETPNVGPAHLLDDPQGGLCRECAKYIERTADGWRVQADPPLPAPVREPNYNDDYCFDD